jgi:hypothetical protein
MAEMADRCYRCDEPAVYTCDTAGCDHKMCAKHAVIRMLGDDESGMGAGGAETRSVAHDHEHLCLDHASVAKA